MKDTALIWKILIVVIGIILIIGTPIFAIIMDEFNNYGNKR
jgi:hypothetical protein